MALIWMDGFDSYGPVVAARGVYNNAAFNTLMLSSGYVFCQGVGVENDTRTGYGKSLWMTWDSLGTPSDWRLAFLPKDEIIVGFAFKFTSTDLANIIEFQFDDRLGTVTPQMRVYANAEGGISLSADGGTTLTAASGPNIIFPNVWQYLEIRYRPNKTEGTIIVKVEGQTCIQFDGKTSQMTTPNQVNMIRFRTPAGEFNIGTQQNPVKRYDDLYVCDTLGSGFNTFQGDVIVHSVKVVSDQGPNSLSQFGGEVGHYAAVDEFPPDDDVSYLYTNTLGDREMFGIDALPANIVDVLAVSTHVRAKKDAPGTSALQCVTQYQTHEARGAVQPLAVQYTTKNQFLEQCPDGTGWTKAKAEALVVGFEVA
ncbi:hypothetical protein [Hyphomicrobium sp.]|uniref:hypothetical protein n=1 Tax=Hyphomicrobium sp. TaxID=82 RepID=UPI001D2B0F92|nr:hypothetical protein [Hyphomicrobium sp.]MBY0560014.1 hypothetical protein [Hyphomicrobium sp.]